MIDRAKILKILAYIIMGVGALYGVIYLVEAQITAGIVVFVLCAVLAVPCLCFLKPQRLGFLTTYMVIGVTVVIFTAQLFSKAIAPGAALYCCSVALSAMFYRRFLVRLSCVCSAILFMSECVILSVAEGQLVENPVVLGECLLAILVACLLVDMSVKNSNHYLEVANEKENEANRLLSDLEEKGRQNEQMLEKQQKLLVQVDQVSEQLTLAASNLSEQSNDLAQGSAEQASTVEELLASITEISSTVKANSDRVKTTTEAGYRISTNLAESGERMEKSLALMEQIHSKVEQVKGIIKTIEDIAFQTNILALNAAVEAARAGAAGKGFAVVAEEVRNLAGKSAEASQNTTELIGSMVEVIEEGRESMSRTKQSLDIVVGASDGMVKEFQQIEEASEHQAEAISQITQGVDQISGVVQNNSATAEQSAAASEELSGQAQELRTMLGGFKRS